MIIGVLMLALAAVCAAVLLYRVVQDLRWLRSGTATSRAIKGQSSVEGFREMVMAQELIQMRHRFKRTMVMTAIGLALMSSPVLVWLPLSGLGDAPYAPLAVLLALAEVLIIATGLHLMSYTDQLKNALPTTHRD